MKLLLKKIFFLIIIIATTIIIVTFFIPPNSDLYLLSFYDKHNRLNKLKSPKIVIIGGSGPSFGINSETIENKLNMPVVNMGLNVGLGLAFITEEIKNKISKNDIIIVIPEHEHFYSKKTLYGNVYLNQLLSTNFNISSHIKTKKQYINLIKHSIDSYQLKIRSIIYDQIFNESIHRYTRKEFNKYGDYIGYKNSPEIRPLISNAAITTTNINSFIEESFLILNNFINYVHEKNAYIILIHPAIPIEDYNKYLNNYLVYEKTLNNKLITSFYSPHKRYTLDLKYFFDTAYHPNIEGGKIRTSLLIKDIKNFIKNKKLLPPSHK
jgi:hypothetical protein